MYTGLIMQCFHSGLSLNIGTSQGRGFLKINRPFMLISYNPHIQMSSWNSNYFFFPSVAVVLFGTCCLLVSVFEIGYDSSLFSCKQSINIVFSAMEIIFIIIQVTHYEIMLYLSYVLDLFLNGSCFSSSCRKDILEKMCVPPPTCTCWYN